MRCVIVSHTHWDREWYRTFQSFRARLVDTVDCVLDLVAADPGFFFQLDGQTIVLEDYVEVRPERRDELIAACRAGRVAIGPWYVQPDSFLPSGESHVRNLLEGRRVASEYGRCAEVAYTPDSFGHPAQLPQIFAGFGLGPFIYWRGNGNEIAELPAEYTWVAPDGSAVRASHLGRGYFNAWGLADDVDAVAERLEKMVHELSERAPRDCVLLMNGMDHMLPDANTREAAEALAKRTGWEVARGLLHDFTNRLEEELPEPVRFSGELCGGRVSNLLPGVWSTRTYLKLANRRCESVLEGWAEPFAVIGEALGAPREAASLRSAWRDLLANQAHDSICGCSQDRVHDQMMFRYDAAEELAEETTLRSLERIAGLGADRQLPRMGQGKVELAVFNPSAHARTDVVRLQLAGFPSFTSAGVNPLLAKNHKTGGFTIDGKPALLRPYLGTARPRLVPDEPVYDLEFVARDVPPLGWSRLLLERADPSPEQEDDEPEIRTGTQIVRASEDGTLELETESGSFRGLFGVEEIGDRGDTYDCDPVPGSGPEATCTLRDVRVRRFRHESGIQRLVVERTFALPARLSQDRQSRSDEQALMRLRIEVRLAPDVDRIDVDITLDDPAEDHRVRLLFPTGGPAESFRAATTFDVATRNRTRPDDSEWIHPAPDTFPSQGWVAANGLMVVAPGLNEAEVLEQGEIALTLLRATGWLSRPDLSTRPGEAGPALPTPGAQCPGRLEMRLALITCPDSDRPREARDAELGLRAVGAGEAPMCEPGRAVLALEPRSLVVSAWKPSDEAGSPVLRISNPTDTPQRARVTLGIDFDSALPVRLDESPADFAIDQNESTLEFDVPPHALRSVRFR